MIRETIEYDVVIVGAGPAGLSAAIKLKQLNPDTSVVILEKGSEVGAHILSGAVLDPTGLNKLIPDWKSKGAPIKTMVSDDKFFLLGPAGSIKIPNFPMPPFMKNHGNYIVSMSNVCRWLAKQAETLGVEIFPGMAVSDLVYDSNDGLKGVVAGEFGLKKWNTFKSAVNGLHNIKHDHVKFPDNRIKYYKKLKEGQNWKNLSKALQKEALGNSYYAGGGKTGFLRRLGWGKPSPTLVTDPTMPATDLAHPELNRPLSIQEYMRIQEFPDNWKLSGSLRNQYKQIGNAVPISLGKAIGKLIIDHMKKKKIKVINNFKYSRYLNTSDMDWQNSINKKVVLSQKSFNFQS